MAREYKDSGIEWIGQIPKEWKIVLTKRFFKYKKLIVGEQVNDYERLALTMQGVIKRNKDDNEGLQPEKFDSYQILRENELVFKLIDLANVKTSRIGLSHYTGIVSPAYIILRNANNDNRYFYYWFLYMYYHLIFNQMGDDGVRSSLNADDVLNIPIASPSQSEQQKIADYLDKVCGEADEMIALQEKMIEELKAYKQSIITEAVTKGLNPNAPMKDSGIDWIGEIPEHWDKDKIIRIFNLIGSGTTPSSSDNELYEGNLNWIQSGDINGGDLYESKNKISEKTLKKYSALTMYDAPFIIIAMYGASVGNISISHINGCVNQACCVMSETKQDFKYVFYAIKSAKDYLIYKAVGGGQPNISQSTLKQLWLPVPSLFEQQQIASFLDSKCSEIDSLIAIKQQKIAELKEYKKSVIYEYVTGKKEVV